MMNLLLILNLASSLFLAGLIWTIQIVHYPIFHRLETNNFADHIHFHKGAISLIVVPVMTLELGTSAWLSWFASSYLIYHQAGFVAVILIWLITFFVQVPLHSRLSVARNEKAIKHLVTTNWLRTILWSAKAALILTIVHKML